jgi:hypothetical protein
MQRSKWNITALLAMLTLATCAMAAQPEPAKAPKTPRAQTYGYWVGDTPGSKGSYLGVDVSDVAKDRISVLKLKDEHGVEITMVDQDAPAGKAGLKEHDVILEFNGARVEGEEQLRRMIRETPPGHKVTLGVSRDGQMLQLPVTLGERSGKTTIWSNSPMVPMPPHGMPSMPATPAPPAFPAFPDIEMPEVNVLVRSYSRSSGMMIDNLTPQLGEFFGVKSGKGVLVRSVEKGSAAESAGLKAGDVIVKIGDEKISDRSDFSRALRERKSTKMPIAIVRDKREQILTITLPEMGPRDSSRLNRKRTSRPDTDVDDEDDDMDIDVDLDMDGIDGAAALLSTKAREMALVQAKQGLLTAQASVNQAMNEWQPRMQEEMKKAQKQIEEQMKRMQEQMREMQDKY